MRSGRIGARRWRSAGPSDAKERVGIIRNAAGTGGGTGGSAIATDGTPSPGSGDGAAFHSAAGSGTESVSAAPTAVGSAIDTESSSTGDESISGGRAGPSTLRGREIAARGATAARLTSAMKQAQFRTDKAAMDVTSRLRRQRSGSTAA